MSAEWMFRTECATFCQQVVVIDPEDREQVERLHALYEGLDKGVEVEDMQAALREFANPKPEEPTDLAARVIDREGDTWARIGDRWVNSQGGKSQPWDFVVETFGPVEVRP